MPGPLTLGQIVDRLGGRVSGDAGTVIEQVAALDGAHERQISFFIGSRYRGKLAATQASAVIVGPESEGETALPRIIADNPYAYFARVSQLSNPVVAQPQGVHPSAVIAKTAKVGARVSIGPG